MKSAVAANFIAIFLLFCCLNVNVAENIENSENAVDLSSQIRGPEAKESTFTSVKHRRTKRMANDECTIDDFENMQLHDVVEAVEKNGDCAERAAKYFQQNYADKYLIVSQKYRTTTINTMKHFGQFIKKMSLQVHFCLTDSWEIEKTEKVLAAIDKYLRKSLVEFHVEYTGCNKNIFNQIRGPFERVEFLDLNLSFLTEQAQNRKLGAIFPNVQRLDIDGHVLQDSSFISELPKLEHLGIGDGLIYDSNKMVFMDLLKENPQITYLSLKYPPFEVLEAVKTYSKHLQELNIVMDTRGKFHSENVDHIKIIHFPTVKHLDISLEYECRPANELVFSVSALRDITLTCGAGDVNNDYINFILKYPKVQKLKAGNGLNNAHLVNLIGKLPKLFYVFFDFSKDIEVSNIIEFVKKSPSLNQMEFVYANIENFDAFEQQLQTQLGADFNIKTYDVEQSKRYSIERKLWIEPDDVMVDAPEKYQLDDNQSVIGNVPHTNAAYTRNSVIYNILVMFMGAYAARYIFL